TKNLSSSQTEIKTETTFTWEDGELIKELTKENPRKIIFKNPPEDPAFKTFAAELQSLRQLEVSERTIKIANDVVFQQTTGTNWELYSKHASLDLLTTDH